MARYDVMETRRESGAQWPTGPGEMAGRVRAHDWAATPLGPVALWPAGLRAVVDLVLASPMVATLALFETRLLIYNDVAARLYGARHPGALGRPLAEMFADSYPTVAAVYDRVFAGESVTISAQPLAVGTGDRGEVFDAYLTPVRDDHGAVIGAHMVGLEIGGRMRDAAALRDSEERQALLLRLSDALRPLADPHEVANTACRLLVGQIGGSQAQYADLSGAPGEEMGRVRGEYVDTGSSFPRNFPLAPFGEPILTILRAGRSLILRDADRDPRLDEVQRSAFHAVSAPAVISVPLVKDGRWIAALTVHDIEPRDWSHGDIELTEAVAERTWAAIERARTEAALRESEERLGRAFDAAEMGAWELDLISHDAWRSEQHDRIFGYAELQPAWTYEIFLDHIVAEDRGEVDGRFQEAIASQGDWVFECRIKRIDDQIRWIWAQGKVGTDHEGRSVRMKGMVRDITDRKVAELALRESEERLRQFGEASQDVLWIRDAETFQWEYLTPAFEIIYGLDREAALSGDNMAGWLELIVPDDRDVAVTSLERVRDGESVTFEYRIRRPADGSVRWLRNTDFPIMNADGAVVRIGGIGHDITALKQTEQALADTKERQRVLVEGIPQLLWRAFDGGRWTWASPQWTEFTGQAEPESHEFGWLVALHPDDRQPVRDVWVDAVDRGMFNADYRLHDHKQKRYRWFTTSATPVRDVRGEIVEWLGTSTDVDDLRNLQNRQERLVAELQHRVRNILTVVRSVFARTVDTREDVEEVADHFRGRLDALARTQVIVTRSAERTVDLEDLVREELLSVAVTDPPGVIIDGPEVKLPANVAETLGLALHELTTNALKYGALKVPGGRLAISWKIDARYGGDRVLNLNWLEQGVPAVPIRPTREGFGRELIEEALPYRLGAETKLQFEGGGVRCSISIPLAADSESALGDTETSR